MTLPEPTKRRGPIYAEYTGPGPLKYNRRTTVGNVDHCKTKYENPSWSFGEKLRIKYNDAPGPSYMYDANVTTKGRQDIPVCTLKSRPPTKGIEILPGPGAYNPQQAPHGVLSTEKKPVSVSMGQRSRYAFKNEAPPPNTYDKPTTLGTGSSTTKGAPSWSMKGRFDYGSPYYIRSRSGVPGPASYGTMQSSDNIKNKAGLYSIQGRTQMKDYNSAKENPGPGSYDPTLPKSRGSSMGIRHSSYVMPLITNADMNF